MYTDSIATYRKLQLIILKVLSNCIFHVRTVYVK